ncbi:MAG: hypothetical protein PHW10_03565 [Candidatus Peribacteraceae bacterium]|nr:hypothetical protein [Candidatus Peribacteraceae bacterium]
MPVRKKKKVSKKKPLKRKKAKAATKKRKPMKKSAKKRGVAKKRKVVSAKKTAVRAARVQAIKEKVLGKVTHYYDRIGVAIVQATSPFGVGDTVLFRRGEQEIAQPVGSLQINHQPVGKVKKGQVVGLKVDAPVHEGSKVFAT